MSRMHSWTLAVALGVGMLSCPGAELDPQREQRPATAERVEATLRDEGFASVLAAVDKGIVTLTGFVTTDDERVRAREVANRLPEVSSVEDRMLVQMLDH